MIALLIAIIILIVGLQGDLTWYWWVVGGLAFLASATPEGYLGPTLWRWAKDRRRQFSRDENPRNFSGRQFEEFVARHLRREGFGPVEVTGGPGDMGADLIAHRGDRKIAVQAKQVSRSVGTEAVQDAVSAREAHDADEGWVVTTAEVITEQARELARRTGIEIQQV